jgi:flagellar biogenesis protein FliO
MKIRIIVIFFIIYNIGYGEILDKKNVENIQQSTKGINTSRYDVNKDIEETSKQRAMQGLENNKREDDEIANEHKVKSLKNKKNTFYDPPKIDANEPKYINMLIKAFLVIGFMILGLYIFSRYVISRRKKNLPRGPIKVVSVLPIGNNKGIYFIELGGKGFLMGITEERISLIREFDENEVSYIKETMEEYNEEKLDFISALRNAFKIPTRGKKRENELLFPKDNLDLIDTYRLRIRKLKEINDEEKED